MGYELNTFIKDCGCIKNTYQHDFFSGDSRTEIIRCIECSMLSQTRNLCPNNQIPFVQTFKQKQEILHKHIKIIKKQNDIKDFKNMIIHVEYIKVALPYKLYHQLNSEAKIQIKAEKINKRYYCCKNRQQLYYKLIYKYINI